MFTDGQTDGRRLDSHPISSPCEPSAQVSSKPSKSSVYALRACTHTVRREYAKGTQRVRTTRYACVERSLKLVSHSLPVRYESVLVRLRFVFSPVCQASMVTFVEFLQDIWAYSRLSTFCNSLPARRLNTSRCKRNFKQGRM